MSNEQELLSKATQGDVQAMHKLGDHYAKENNFESALHWYQKSYQQGNLLSAHNIGNLYLMKGDESNADVWLQKVALMRHSI